MRGTSCRTWAVALALVATPAAAQPPTDSASATDADASHAQTATDARAPTATPRAADASSAVPAVDAGAVTDATVESATTPAGADGGVASSDASTTAPTRASEPSRPAEATAGQRTGLVIRAILGLLAAVVLAWIATHPRVRRFEERLGIAQVVTAGFPFVLLGLLGRNPSVGFLTDEVLEHLTPLLYFALGWIGTWTGFRFDLRMADQMAEGSARVVTLVTTAPLLVVGLVAAALFWLVGVSTGPQALLRDALTIGIAGALAEPAAMHLLERANLSARALHLVRSVTFTDAIAAVAALGLLGAYYRPAGADPGWNLPGTIWLFVTLGMGVAVGALGWFALARVRAGAEEVAMLLGIVALAAGMAAYLDFSPIVVGFIVGLVLGNLPGENRERLGQSLERLERPTYLLLLLVAGALWDVSDWRGWLLLPCFVLARLAGRWLGLVAAARAEHTHTAASTLWSARNALVAAPLGAFSVAVVVNAQSLYRSEAMPLLVTAVIGGAFVTELLAQWLVPRSGHEGPPTPSSGAVLAGGAETTLPDGSPTGGAR